MALPKIKYKLTSTVPVVPFGNLIPEIELEGTDIEKLHAKAMEHMQEVWDNYSEKPLRKNSEAPVDGIAFEELVSFTGERILWSDYLHEYRSLDGQRLTSGSTYAGLLEKPFDSSLLSEKSGKAWGVNAGELEELWKMNGKIATDYGTAIHQALETYMKFWRLGEVVQQKKGLEYNYALPKNDYLRGIVLGFVELFGTFDESEVLVSDVNNQMAGQIDGMKILDMSKKLCSLGDYKTNFEMKKAKLSTYSKQMNFYRTALENKGWTVQEMTVYHLDGNKWNMHPIQREDVDFSLFKK